MVTGEEGAKRAVARHAIDTFVRPNTCIGLGTGSTARYAIERVGELVAAGTSLRAVATSHETERMCRDARIPLVQLADEPIDVAIDGADEVDPQWALIKGGGGALFREKAVAIAARSFVVIVTERKCVERLGAFPLPVEVVPFSTAYVAHELEALGARVALRRTGNDGKAYVTDNGNAILDCSFDTISSPAILDRIVGEIHGVVTTGLFIGLTSSVLISKPDGSIAARDRRAVR
ncbi:MAG: ribose 5-phosphate isomerase A [Vulcanimicrobiaceae bacterium]